MREVPFTIAAALSIGAVLTPSLELGVLAGLFWIWYLLVERLIKSEQTENPAGLAESAEGHIRKAEKGRVGATERRH